MRDLWSAVVAGRTRIDMTSSNRFFFVYTLRHWSTLDSRHSTAADVADSLVDIYLMCEFARKILETIFIRVFHCAPVYLPDFSLKLRLLHHMAHDKT